MKILKNNTLPQNRIKQFAEKQQKCKKNIKKLPSFFSWFIVLMFLVLKF